METPKPSALSDALTAQIDAEATAIASAPIVLPLPVAGRCHFCGQMSVTLTPVYGPTGEVSHYKGECCGG